MLTLLFLSFTLQAQIICTHPQACNLASALLAEKQELKNALPVNVDAHDFDPNIKQMKELLSAKILITAPLELQPWLKNITSTRAKNKLATFSIQTIGEPKTMKSKAHFWMYPESVCFNWMYLRQFLADQKLKVISDDCQSPGSPQTSTDKIFVLSHNAVEPLLMKYSSRVISLKTSDHHAEILPSTLKQLTTLPDGPQVVWILEKNILIPEQIIKTYRKPKQTMLSFDLDGTIGEKPHDRFRDLIKKIGL